MDNHMIVLDHMTKVYGSQKALDNVNLEIKAGEFVFLTGNSEAGKTAMLELILRETEPTEGNLIINGIQLSQLKERQIYRYRRSIGMVSQDLKLLPDFTVYENVAFTQRVTGAGPRDMKVSVRDVLFKVGLEKKAGYYPGQLSGGEKQRMALVRTMVNRPVLLLADESTGNLNQRNAEDITRLLEKINDQGTTILTVSHNQNLVKSMKRKEISIRYEKVIQDGGKGGLSYEFQDLEISL